MMTRLEQELESALLELHGRWKAELGWNAEFFRQMFIKTRSNRYRGPVGAVIHVLTSKTAGLSRLEEAGRPDLSVEALAIEPRWKPLFSEPFIRIAKRRLADFGKER